MQELIQYIIVNKDLGMSPGKIAAQVGHACTICTMNEKDHPDFLRWYMGEQKKIVLGAHEKDLRKLMDFGYPVIDAGYTEIPVSSLTCISLGVRTKEDVQKYVKRLQLL